MYKYFTLMVFMTLAVFSGCQKQELEVNRLGEQLPANELQSRSEITSGVYAESDYLVFNNYEALNSLREKLDVMSDVDLIAYEKQSGYKSAFSHRKELLAKADMIQENGTQAELLEYLTEVSKTGYFSFEDKEFVYPFSELLAKVLSPDGKFKVGETSYRFTNTAQTVTTADGKEETVQLNAGLPTTRAIVPESELVGQETMLADGQLRTLLQLKRKLIFPLGIIPGAPVAFNWHVYLRFYSYRQYALYKSDRPTYFNFKIRKVQLGGNSGYGTVNFYNANPSVERSTNQGAVVYRYLLKTPQMLSADTQPPVIAIQAVQVPDFWSDFMSNFHGSLTYP